MKYNDPVFVVYKRNIGGGMDIISAHDSEANARSTIDICIAPVLFDVTQFSDGKIFKLEESPVEYGYFTRGLNRVFNHE
jgi:hypothetical protein